MLFGWDYEDSWDEMVKKFGWDEEDRKRANAMHEQWIKAKEKHKQEAVKPTLIREGRNKNYNDYVCPRCDNEVVYEQNYCSECGVQFLWEGR